MLIWLVRLLGLVFALGGIVVAYRGMEALEDIRREGMEIFKLENELGANRIPRESGERNLAASRRRLEERTTYRNLQFGIALGALILGIGMVFLPSSRKRKARPVKVPLGDPPAPATP